MIKNKINIVFERIQNINIIGYEILVTDPITAMQKRIAVIDNPKDMNPVRIKERVIDTDRPRSDIYSRIYDIRHKNLIVNQDTHMKVFVNGEIAPTDLYILNQVKQQLIVFAIIKDDDFVELEYYIDGIEYEMISDSEGEVTVKPLFNDTNVTVGRHSILV